MFLLFLLVSAVSAANVLVWNPVMGQSHVNFLGNIADVLHRNGHNVTVVAPIFDSSLKPFGAKENVTKVLFRSKYLTSEGWEVPAATGEVWEQELSTGSNVNWDEFTQFIDKYALICKGFLEDVELVRSLKNSKFDIGIAETFDLSAVGFFELLGVPKIVVAGALGQIDYHNIVTGIPQITSFTPSWMSSFTEKMSFHQRYVTLKLMLESMHFQRYADKTIQDVFENYHPGFPNLMQVYLNKTGVILNNVNEFTESPRLRTNMIQYVGGSNFYVKPLSKEADNLLSKRKDSVLFSLGSFVKSCGMPLKIKRAFADSFAAFPDTTFIWKYENCPNDTFAKEQYKNIIFSNWVPQNELLNDPRLVLFITHGGMNSILESSHAGVPMLTIPVFADQMMNAINAVDRGIAIKLDRTKIEKDTLVELIEKLIQKDSVYHTRAINMKHILKDRPEQYRELINHWVERLTMENGPIENLALVTREMSYFTIFSLDIVSVLLFVFLSILAVIYFVVKTLLSFVSIRLVKTKKD